MVKEMRVPGRHDVDGELAYSPHGTTHDAPRTRRSALRRLLSSTANRTVTATAFGATVLIPRWCITTLASQEQERSFGFVVTRLRNLFWFLQLLSPARWLRANTIIPHLFSETNKNGHFSIIKPSGVNTKINCLTRFA